MASSNIRRKIEDCQNILATSKSTTKIQKTIEEVFDTAAQWLQGMPQKSRNPDLRVTKASHLSAMIGAYAGSARLLSQSKENGGKISEEDHQSLVDRAEELLEVLQVSCPDPDLHREMWIPEHLKKDLVAAADEDMDNFSASITTQSVNSKQRQYIEELEREKRDTEQTLNTITSQMMAFEPAEIRSHGVVTFGSQSASSVSEDVREAVQRFEEITSAQVEQAEQVHRSQLELITSKLQDAHISTGLEQEEQELVRMFLARAERQADARGLDGEEKAEFVERVGGHSLWLAGLRGYSAASGLDRSFESERLTDSDHAMTNMDVGSQINAPHRQELVQKARSISVADIRSNFDECTQARQVMGMQPDQSMEDDEMTGEPDEDDSKNKEADWEGWDD